MSAEPFTLEMQKPTRARVDFSTAEDRGQGMLDVCDAGCGL